MLAGGFIQRRDRTDKKLMSRHPARMRKKTVDRRRAHPFLEEGLFFRRFFFRLECEETILSV